MIKTAGFLASAMVNGMDLGSIAAARSQSFQEFEKRGWKREIGEPERKEKKRGMAGGGGDWFQSQEEEGESEYELDGDSQKEGRDSERVNGVSEEEFLRILKGQAPKTKSTKSPSCVWDLDSFGQLD